ncbi:MAG TPA: hypothetical protein VM386_02115 [Acidimicrobiales bacterium]|nr:hypothetical protein [Acidimicrobiales bacterium]
MASGTDRMMMAKALRVLADEARSRRAGLPFESSERQFYLGVEAATAAVLHPEAQDAKPMDWLDREPTAFRNGYLSTTAEIAAVTSGPAVPVRLRLPVPARLPPGASGGT